MLAYGSNAAAEALRRKFADFGREVRIPVTRARLAGFDVVYSAHTNRGAIPVTLQASPGCVADVYVLELTAGEIEHMHVTESLGTNYAFARLQRIELRLESGEELHAVDTYLSLHGLFAPAGTEIAASAIGADGRSFPALDEPGVLEEARRRVAPDLELDAFVAANAADPVAARRTTAAMHGWSLPFAWQDWERLAG